MQESNPANCLLNCHFSWVGNLDFEGPPSVPCFFPKNSNVTNRSFSDLLEDEWFQVVLKHAKVTFHMVGCFWVIVGIVKFTNSNHMNDQAGNCWWNIFMFEDVWWKTVDGSYCSMQNKQSFILTEILHKQWIHHDTLCFRMKFGHSHPRSNLVVFNPPFGSKHLNIWQSSPRSFASKLGICDPKQVFFVIQKQPNLSFPLNRWNGWRNMQYPVTRSDFFSSLVCRKIEKCKVFFFQWELTIHPF